MDVAREQIDIGKSSLGRVDEPRDRDTVLEIDRVDRLVPDGPTQRRA